MEEEGERRKMMSNLKAGLVAVLFVSGVLGLLTYYALEPIEVTKNVKPLLSPLDLPVLDGIREDPCVGLELPGKYVPTFSGLRQVGMILHFRGRVSREHRNCIGDVAGVEDTWIPEATHYQILVTRAKLYSWDEIKAGIENTLRWGADSTYTFDYTVGTSLDGGQPAQKVERRK